jgi:hypothetical protein
MNRTMKKTLLMAALLIGICCCENKQPKETTKVVTDKQATETPAKDIFFYTMKHRADKYVPTEEKMGFGSTIQSINDSEFAGNKSIKEVWIAPQIQHIVNKAFYGCTSLERYTSKARFPSSTTRHSRGALP